MEKFQEQLEDYLEAYVDKVDEVKDWLTDALRYRKAWRLHLAFCCMSLATGFGNPIVYAALLSSVEGNYMVAHILWIRSLSLTAFVSAFCTIFWFSAADCIGRKTLLVNTMATRAVQFYLMGMLLSGSMGSWMTYIWYAASIVEGLNPSEVISVEWLAWMELTEGDDEMRTRTLVLARIITALSVGLGTGFSIAFLQMGFFQVVSFSVWYIFLSAVCLLSMMLLIGLDMPDGKKRPKLSVNSMVTMAKEMLHLFQDKYNFWAIVKHCVDSAMAFRSMVVPTFCFVHYGWSQDEYMLATMVQSFGGFLSPLAPKIIAFCGETFIYIYMDILSFLFYEVLGLFCPLDSTFFILQQVLCTPVKAWFSVSQQDTHQRVPYNKPEVRGRSAALFTGLSKVIHGLASPVLARTFDARAQTYRAQVAPFAVMLALGLTSRIIFIWKLWPTESEILQDLYCERRGLQRIDKVDNANPPPIAKAAVAMEASAGSKKSKKSKKSD